MFFMLKQYKEAIEKSNILSRTDTRGFITFVNEEFCKISGYTRDELIGQNHNIVRHPSVNPSAFRNLWDTIKNKKIYKATVKNLAKNGSTFYVNTTIIPILDTDNAISEFIAIRYDVTKEVFYKEALIKKDEELEKLNKTLELKVYEKTKELEELNKTLEQRVKEEILKNEAKQKVMFLQSRLASLGQMLANIAHQWRQPLTELNLILFTMKESFRDNNLENFILSYNDTKKITKNMSQTIEDFTNFFKPQKEKAPFKISKSINESLSLLDKIIRSEKIEVKTDLKPIEVLGISNELTQVIVNLIKNSIDAFVINNILTREIKIRLEANDRFAFISIWDNAGGIKEENLDKIFEPYFTTKHQSSGTGLGLFMSKMICEQGLAGCIDVKSNNNMTKFMIKIPLG